MTVGREYGTSKLAVSTVTVMMKLHLARRVIERLKKPVDQVG